MTFGKWASMWHHEKEPLTLWHHEDATPKSCNSKRLTKLASSPSSLKNSGENSPPNPEIFPCYEKKLSQKFAISISSLEI